MKRGDLWSDVEIVERDRPTAQYTDQDLIKDLDLVRDSRRLGLRQPLLLDDMRCLLGLLLFLGLPGRFAPAAQLLAATAPTPGSSSAPATTPTASRDPTDVGTRHAGPPTIQLANLGHLTPTT
jgi:hypothetical protein